MRAGERGRRARGEEGRGEGSRAGSARLGAGGPGLTPAAPRCSVNAPSAAAEGAAGPGRGCGEGGGSGGVGPARSVLPGGALALEAAEERAPCGVLLPSALLQLPESLGCPGVGFRVGFLV